MTLIFSTEEADNTTRVGATGHRLVGRAARDPLRPHPGGRVCAWSSLGSELETHHYGVKDKRGFKRMGHCLGRDQHFLSVNIYSSVSSVRLHIFNEVCFCLTLNSHIISDYSDRLTRVSTVARLTGLASSFRVPRVMAASIYCDRAGEK